MGGRRRRVGAASIVVSFIIGASVVRARRTDDGIVALYDFEEGEGTVINDVSGAGDPLSFTIPDPAAVQWTTGGLAAVAPTRIISPAPATKIIGACTASNEITIEAWVEPATLDAAGPARIVSLSADTANRNFTLAQDGTFYVVRLRTTTTGNNGTPPDTRTAAGSLTTDLTHIVYTWTQATSEAVIYLDGQPAATETIAGDLSAWDPGYRLVLANEIVSDPITQRDWPGEYQLVAIYDRALTPEEVADNYAAGPALDAGCPFALTAVRSAGGVVLAWHDGEVTPASVLIRRNGAVIESAAPASPPAYTDAAPPAGLLSYELTFDVPGETCRSLTARYNGCISGLQAVRTQDGITLAWKNSLTYDGIEVRRNGTVLAAALPGTAETYTDRDPPQEGLVTYRVNPTSGTCDPAAVDVDFACWLQAPVCDVMPGGPRGELVAAFAFGMHPAFPP